MEDIPGGYWRRSFVTEYESLAELMEAWLGGTTFEDETRRSLDHSKLPPEEDPAEIAVGYFAQLSPEERAAAGLPEIGWEDVLRRRHRF